MNKIREWLKKYLIDENWWINISIGILAAIFLPELLPLKIENLVEIDPKYIHISNQLLWGIVFLFGTEFVKLVFNVPKQIKASLDKHKGEITKSFYAGFFTLLTGTKDELQAQLERIDEAFEDLSFSDSQSRSVILDFLIHCLSRMGVSGFISHKTRVGVYVEYIAKSLQIHDANVFATCKVRPFWFVTNSMSVNGGKKIILEPKIESDKEYGKGEHLKYFQGKGHKDSKRLLVLSDEMLAEIFLTAYIDKKRDFNVTITRNTINDIPEIDWFKQDVNEQRNVKLYYVHEDYRDLRDDLQKLGDRVLIFKLRNGRRLGISIEFEFVNLETGTMVLSWGNQINDECFSISEKLSSGPLSGIKTDFKEFLKNSDFARPGMRRHLERLEKICEDFFNNYIHTIDNSEIRTVLSNNKNIISEAFTSLDKELQSKALDRIYDELVNQYVKKKGFPENAIIITYDMRHPNYPVRIADWYKNWEDIKNDS